VISGLAAVVLAVPWVRIVLFALSTAYLLYIALRIAFAGSSIRFITVQSKPGVLAGILLQPINPKAYAVNTALFSGFAMFPDALVAEALWKLVIVNAIWLPIHVLWVWFGTVLQKLELQPRQHRLINMAMASSMLFVVALAVASAF
jgi:threonine/homoserine/homoserine lactone efflux protein